MPADEVKNSPSEQAVRSRDREEVVEVADAAVKGGKQRGVQLQSASGTKKVGIKGAKGQAHAEFPEAGLVESDPQGEHCASRKQSASVTLCYC